MLRVVRGEYVISCFFGKFKFKFFGEVIEGKIFFGSSIVVCRIDLSLDL